MWWVYWVEENEQSQDIEYIKKNLSLYPNPVEEDIFINNGGNFTSYFISSATRKFVREGARTESISLLDLHPGIYMITFVYENGHRVSRKFVKAD